MKVSRQWYRHLELDEDKKKLTDVLTHSTEVLRVLRIILEREYMASISKHDKKKSYMLPAWSENQADGIGERRTLQKIIDLIDLEK